MKINLQKMVILIAVFFLASVFCVFPAGQNEGSGKGSPEKTITVYMQMGGTEGDPSTLARTNGAKAAAAQMGVKLVEQYSGWQPEKMPVMGCHPGDAIPFEEGGICSRVSLSGVR